jgi:hypothetical protein
MTTLYNATLELSKILQNTPESLATGGSLTTLLDTARLEVADYFDKGTIWFMSGNNAGKSAVIDAWSGQTFTFSTQALACAAANRYAAASAEFPRWLLIQKINEAYRKLAEVSENKTLTTVADQEEYTLPSGVYNVKRVDIATYTSTPYYWGRHMRWTERDGKLVFDHDHAPAESGYLIRLLYQIAPAELTGDTGTISDTINIDRLIWNAAVEALRWKLAMIGSDRPEEMRRYQESLANAMLMTSHYPIENINKDPHLATW